VSIPGFEISGELGRGAMGVVYRARQIKLDRLVALKMILPSARANPGQLARFLTEAEAVARLHHPNIVQIFEVGEHDGTPYFALEYVNGGTLAKKVRDVPQPPVEAARLIAVLAQAMEVAHRAGIVHRDLKPANVLLTSDGVPKIADFGLAKRLDKPLGDTRTGDIMGTPTYMAPEQAAGRNREVGTASDVYALGAILYDLLTGRPPFRSASVMETMMQILTLDPVPPCRLQPQLPRDLETICLKCLHKERNRRYASAKALAEDLHRFLVGEPIHARPVGRVERGRKWVKRKPALAGLIGLSVLVGLGVIGGGVVYVRDQVDRLRKGQEEAHKAELSKQYADWSVDGATARVQGNYEEALAIYERQRDLIEREPSLEDRRQENTTNVQEMQKKLLAISQRRGALDKYDRFKAAYDEAIFHATLAYGDGVAANRQEARKAADEALGEFGIGADQTGPPSVDPALDELQTAIRTACAELLLVRADTQAGNGAEAARTAMHILDGVGEWMSRDQGGPTYAYHQLRSRYLKQAGDPGARKEQDWVDSHEPKTATDYYLVGAEHFQDGNVFRARTDFEKALIQNADHFCARYFLAICDFQLNRSEDALVNLELCIRKNSKFVWTYLVRGLVHIQLGSYAKAEDDFRTANDMAVGNDARYVLYVNQGALALEQKNAALKQGDLALERKRTAEARGYFEKAVELLPDQIAAYVSLADLYKRDKQWADAIAQITKAIDRAPKRPDLLRIRGGFHAEAKQEIAALSDLDEAIRQQATRKPPALVADWLEKGRILTQLNRLKEAVRAYERARTIDANNTEVHLALAKVFYRQQDYRKVIEFLGKYLEMGGGPSADIYVLRARAHAEIGEVPEAIQDYTRALARQPDDPELLAARGWARLVDNDAIGAWKDFDELIRKPKLAANGLAYVGRGSAAVKQGYWKQAIEDADAALRLLEKPSKRDHYNLARLFAQAIAWINARPEDRVQHQAEARLCEKKALDQLDQCLRLVKPAERSAFWLTHVVPDKALDPLRRLTRFQQMDDLFQRAARQRVGAP
jgi:tetratricopeptide (TPR) repeat protein/tRNA A-37 threonylcarbamoyl transferase component Bud32